MPLDLSAHADLIAAYEARTRDMRVAAAQRRAEVPLRFWRQQAHFTTPASNGDMVRKAVEGGLAATPKILEKFGIGIEELADRFEVEPADIDAVLGGDPHSPLVMVDGEDAQALREDVVARGRENAIAVFDEADWRHTLRFYRPSGLKLDYSVTDIVGVLTHVDPTAGAGGRFPVDGIIWPKAEHAGEVRMVSDLLGDIEARLGLPENSVKFEFLVESGWAIQNLRELVAACLPRLVGIIWGIADYSADIMLPEIRNDHPVCDWARAEIVNMAGAVDVPAIDSMTVNYPVADASLDPAANRARILERLVECFRDARHGADLGMDGKWVGHPAQLFCVLLAYRTRLSEADVAENLEIVAAYSDAVAAAQGATIIKGVMSDRATDRHVRNVLRKACALGLLDPTRALDLGLISAAEAEQVVAV